MQRGKKYKAAADKIDASRIYPVTEAIKLLRENKTAKFDEAVEIHVKTNIDPKKGEQQVRGTVVLPRGTGKTKKIAVVTSTQTEAAKKAGADIVGGEEIIEKLAKKIDFDILIATPEMMPKLAKVAKILGPKGLMPNPKSETVTTKIAETVAALKKGKAAFKNDDTGNIHQVVGRVSFTVDHLQENIQVFLTTLEKSKPAGLKGKFITGITLCLTMSKGIRIKQ
jgi:large subunit ribosomal protein L1